MEKIFKIGELVYCSNRSFYVAGNKEGYGIIVDIIDPNTNESFHEMKIITGCGDRNTKVSIIVDIVSKEIDDLFTASEKIITCLKSRGIYNPHSVYKRTFESFEKIYKKTILNLESNMRFYKKYSLSREKKIQIIIDE